MSTLINILFSDFDDIDILVFNFLKLKKKSVLNFYIYFNPILTIV